VFLVEPWRFSFDDKTQSTKLKQKQKNKNKNKVSVSRPTTWSSIPLNILPTITLNPSCFPPRFNSIFGAPILTTNADLDLSFNFVCFSFSFSRFFLFSPAQKLDGSFFRSKLSCIHLILKTKHKKLQYILPVCYHS
jgi:hypothetical protein